MPPHFRTPVRPAALWRRPDDIRIGGVRAVNQTAGLLIDDTLDSKLEQQHDWFTRESGLTVE